MYGLQKMGISEIMSFFEKILGLVYGVFLVFHGSLLVVFKTILFKIYLGQICFQLFMGYVKNIGHRPIF